MKYSVAKPWHGESGTLYYVGTDESPMEYSFRDQETAEAVCLALNAERHAWTGGDVPPKRFKNMTYRWLRRKFFRHEVQICGGLDLWECAGTSALERARIFWNRAGLDAWRTFTRL